MTAERRNGRPNRPRNYRGLRTGVMALLALSSGVGCGQSMLRSGGGPGLAAESLGLTSEPIPSRNLTWSESGPEGVPNRPGSGTISGVLASANGGATVGADLLSVAPTAINADPSVYDRMKSDGWKQPSSKPATAVASKPATARPDVASSEIEAMPATVPVAPRVATVAAPARPASEPETGLKGLMEACKATKIAPPVSFASLAKPAATPPLVEVSETTPVVAEKPGPSVSEVVIGPIAEPPIEAPASPVTEVVIKTVKPDIEPPAPVGSQEPPLLPSGSLDSSVLLPTQVAETPDPNVNAASSTGQPTTVIPMPETPTDSQAAALVAASRESNIELPRRPGASVNAVGTAGPSTSLAPAVAGTSIPTADPLATACEATKIPPPVRAASLVDPLLEASRATKIPLPVPVQTR